MADKFGRIECVMKGESAYIPLGVVQANAINLHNLANDIYRWSQVKDPKVMQDLVLGACEGISVSLDVIRRHLAEADATKAVKP